MKRFSKIIGIFWVAMMVYSTGISKEMVVGVGNFEPYFIEKTQGGLFVELIQATFDNIPDYDPKFLYLPYQRLTKQYNTKKIGIAANVLTLEGCLSAPIFRFTDVGVSLKSRNLKIESFDDLKNLGIGTYQGAKVFHGKEFEKAVTGNPRYLELAQPQAQAKMLVAGRVDISIGDIYIFLHTIKSSYAKEFRSSDFDFHNIFRSAYTKMVFRDEQLCKKFDVALEQIKKEGTYEKIYQDYLSNLKG